MVPLRRSIRNCRLLTDARRLCWMAPRSSPRNENGPQFMPTRRAIITGGAVFLGSHLCDALLEEGCAVVESRRCRHDPKLQFEKFPKSEY